MSLKHAILGFLDQKEESGYDLQKKIDSTINHFWPSTQSQIYRTLKELVKDGQVDLRLVYQDGKPNKKNYSITPTGKKELKSWLEADIDLPNHRNQFLVQLFFSDNLDKQKIRGNLRHYRSIQMQRLDFIKERTPETPKHKLYWLIAQNGIMALENEIKWVDLAMETIQE